MNKKIESPRHLPGAFALEEASVNLGVLLTVRTIADRCELRPTVQVILRIDTEGQLARLDRLHDVFVGILGVGKRNACLEIQEIEGLPLVGLINLAVVARNVENLRSLDFLQSELLVVGKHCCHD